MQWVQNRAQGHCARDAFGLVPGTLPLFRTVLNCAGLSVHVRSSAAPVGAALDGAFLALRPLVPPWFAYMVGRIRLCAKEMPGMLLDVSAHLARQTDALYSEV